MSIRTTLYPSYEAWLAAGSPVGGVFPAGPASDDDVAVPERYRGVPRYYVALPNGQTWCPWKRAYNREQGFHGEGWNISGDIPGCMTVTPSINASPDRADPKDRWHGYLTNGELHL